MIVTLMTWEDRSEVAGGRRWVEQGEMHLDEVAERLGIPMLSVAWDRDVPDLIPQPCLTYRGRPIALYAPIALHAPIVGVSSFPCRIFAAFEATGGHVALAFHEDRWQWIYNDGTHDPAVYRNGEWCVRPVVP